LQQPAALPDNCALARVGARQVCGQPAI